LSHKWFNQIESSCPSLKEVYFTRKKGTKVVGWTDVVLMQTIREPQLLPCGHISDLEPLLKTKKCCFDHIEVKRDELLPLEPSISHLYLNTKNNKWEVDIVDASRQPLEDRTIYHTNCGTFYNMDTVKGLYNSDPDVMNNTDLLQSLAGNLCRECRTSFNGSVRICYPNSVQTNPEDLNWTNLSQISSYISFHSKN